MFCFCLFVCPPQIRSLQPLPFVRVLPYRIFTSGFFNSLGEIKLENLILGEWLDQNRDLVNNYLSKDNSGGFRGF